MTHILLIYDSFIPSVRLCAYEQLKYLSDKSVITFDHCLAKNITQAMCLKSDVVIFVRSVSIIEEKLAIQFKKNGKELVYVLDDDLLNVSDKVPSSINYKSKYVIKRMKSIMELCDVLLTPSLNIMHKYKNMFKKVIIIEEPCIESSNIEQNKDLEIDNSVIRIGFAGSMDRTDDLNGFISDVVIKLISIYGNKISVEFMGAKPALVNKYCLKYYPYEEDYSRYRLKLNALNWDIGVAPMPNSKFHQCKHYNKFIEYSANSIIGVYSNVEPYTRIIENKRNGLLCDNTVEDWVSAIAWLIDNRVHREIIKENIAKEMRGKFSIQVVTEEFYNSIPELFVYKAGRNNKIPLGRLKLVCYLQKVLQYFVRNGMQTPKALLHRFFKRTND